MNIKQEKRNKIFLIIFILIVSIYFSTGMHELGHAATLTFYGCQIPTPAIYFPTPIGGTDCVHPDKFYDNLNLVHRNMITANGPIFVFIIGLLFLIFYRFSNYSKKYSNIAIVTYFFSFSLISNGLLQFFMSGDLNNLINRGFNPVYFYILGIIASILIIYQLFIFKNLLKEVEPRFNKKEIKIISITWIILVILYFAIYFLLPLIF